MYISLRFHRFFSDASHRPGADVDPRFIYMSLPKIISYTSAVKVMVILYHLNRRTSDICLRAILENPGIYIVMVYCITNKPTDTSMLESWIDPSRSLSPPPIPGIALRPAVGRHQGVPHLLHTAHVHRAQAPKIHIFLIC